MTILTTSLSVDDPGFGQSAHVHVQDYRRCDADAAVPLTGVTLGSLSIITAEMSPHQFANALRVIAKRVDVAYDTWLTERTAAAV